jgi:hypothetical protein
MAIALIRERWLWESTDYPREHGASAPATHHPHRVFGTVGNTSDTSGDARAVQSFEAGSSWRCHRIVDF